MNLLIKSQLLYQLSYRSGDRKPAGRRVYRSVFGFPSHWTAFSALGFGPARQIAARRLFDREPIRGATDKSEDRASLEVRTPQLTTISRGDRANGRTAVPQLDRAPESAGHLSASQSLARCCAGYCSPGNLSSAVLPDRRPSPASSTARTGHVVAPPGSRRKAAGITTGE